MEIWKDIEGYEGYYQVSNMGSVQSLNRTCTNKNNKIMTFKGKILKPQNDRCGYLCVLLSLNGIKRNFKIHRLVAQAFIDNSNNKPCVNHKDGNKTNNMVYNLEWCTQQENIAHAIQNTLMNNYGEYSRNATVNNNTVLQIINDLQNTQQTQNEIAKTHNTTIDVIFSINKGNTWRHIAPELSRPIRKKTHKLRDDQVIAIRNMYSTKKYTYVELAQIFNVSESMISLIINNKRRFHE